MRGSRRDDALVLQEAAWSVDAVPRTDAVQRVKKVTVVRDSVPRGSPLFVEIKGIEGAKGKAIDQGHRRRDGHSQESAGNAFPRSRIRRAVIAAAKESTAKLLAAGDAIDPRHGVLVVAVRITGQREKLAEIAELVAFRGHPGAADTPQLQHDFGDGAGQPQTTHGSVEPIRVFGGRACQARAIGSQKGEADHMVGDRSGPMMVFAMHVIGDGAAQRHEPRSWRYRQEPPLRYDKVKDVGE